MNNQHKWKTDLMPNQFRTLCAVKYDKDKFKLQQGHQAETANWKVRTYSQNTDARVKFKGDAYVAARQHQVNKESKASNINVRN